MTDKIISMIVAVSDNQVIGKDNELPWRLSADLRYFKKQTIGKPIIMGRKTWQSIGKPLPDRLNIVVTRDPAFEAAGATVVHSLKAALDAAGDCSEVMIIGGSMLYQEAMPLIDRVYITNVHVEVDDGDAHFPELDEAEWQTHCSHFLRGEKGEPDCTFRVLDRLANAGVQSGVG